MSHPVRHRHRGRKRTVRAAAVTAVVISLALVIGGLFVYRHLEGNITAVDTSRVLGTDRPDKEVDEGQPLEPLNVLLLGSDEREGQAAKIGGESPGLSDTTILLHLSADRERTYGVSLPRDAIIDRPECFTEDGDVIPGETAMFNTAYALGGPACTQRTVEQLTGIHIDHFVVVKFDGFKHMVDALGGVEICVPQEVDDSAHQIYLPAGTYEADGAQALNYVRVRSIISGNGDIGRMKRQQAFLASMANKAISAGTLANPVKLYNFLDAATKSLITDPELANLKNLADLANEVRGIGLDKVQFITVPWEWYEPDPNRVVWAPAADELWELLRRDRPLTPKLTDGVIAAADAPSANRPDDAASPSDGATPEEQPSASPSASPTDEEQAEAAQAREHGLCA